LKKITPFFVFRLQLVVLPKQAAGRKRLTKGAPVNDASMKEKSERKGVSK